ncbi:AAA family ATPase [Roseateles sp. So40a]|uniref:AAA family ATPase n=1 Tax=Roseateles sp. So40a TaxID=3400226 RepID=UPI003A8B25B5
MTILNEIQKWAERLPAWQQHAVAILYERRRPEQEDLEAIYTLLLGSKGVPGLMEIEPRKLTQEQVGAAQVGERLVQLTAVKNLQHVNALAPGKTLALAPTGLTGIYGDNGAGKSGYNRVLKRACRARDAKERIRPNAYAPPVQGSVASAEFEVLVDGEAVGLVWTDGQTSPGELSSIAIFDSHCARAYVDNHGDFSYIPYGLDILEGLAKVCAHLKARIEHELVAAQPNLEPFARLAQSPTAAGLLAKGLSAKTLPEDIEKLGTLKAGELERLESLVRTLAEADPKRRAAELRLRASRVETLVGRIDTSAAIVAEAKVEELQDLISRSDKAKAISQAVAQRFSDVGSVEGTGSELWETLFKAARGFCASTGSLKAFPELGANDPCPLCQNPIGDTGAARLRTFDEFIEGEAAQAATAARRTAGSAFKALVDAPLNLGFDETLVHDLDGHAELIAACEALQLALHARSAAVRRAADPSVEGTWEQVPALPPNPRDDLLAVAKTWNDAATQLDQSQNAAARAAMEKELAELQARSQLADLKSTALDTVRKFILSGQLAGCLTATSTTAISRKSTELMNTMATEEVAAALRQELKALGIHGINVELQPSSARAKTTFKLVLNSKSGAVPEEILSEGEQRAIAIAAFLAEVKLGNGRGGIVFDDPVSSLDHARRELVARRIAAEATHRQVVVFTHDIYFLNVLMYEAAKLELAPKTLTLNETPEGFGVAEETLPFAGATVAQRVGMLRNKQVDCARLHKNGDKPGYRRLTLELYSDLRMSWERGVEEVLFNEAVLRFRKGVETNRLKQVTIEPEDIAAITSGMAKCSNFTGHDGAMVANVAMPPPDELSADISALEDWRKSVMVRRNAKRA